MEKIIEALNTAIEFEKKGYDVYTGAAEKTKNKFGRETLLAIAKKEIDHIKAIEQFITTISSKSNDLSRAIGNINMKEKEKYVEDVFSKLKGQLENKVIPDSDLEASYKVAMDLETESYDFYEKLAEESTDEQSKKFFKFLMKEENTHYELLQDTLLYLNKPDEWFKEQEKWIVEG